MHDFASFRFLHKLFTQSFFFRFVRCRILSYFYFFNEKNKNMRQPFTRNNGDNRRIAEKSGKINIFIMQCSVIVVSSSHTNKADRTE